MWYFFPISAMTPSPLGDRKDIQPVKSWVLVLVVMIWLELCTLYSNYQTTVVWLVCVPRLLVDIGTVGHWSNEAALFWQEGCTLDYWVEKVIKVECIIDCYIVKERRSVNACVYRSACWCKLGVTNTSDGVDIQTACNNSEQSSRQ